MRLLRYSIFIFFISATASLVREVSQDFERVYYEEIRELVYSRPTFTEEVWWILHNDDNQYHQSNTIPITIGLSAQQVLSQTSWGEPETINRTEKEYSVREQWVYPDYNYLYFENGYLVAISTSENL